MAELVGKGHAVWLDNFYSSPALAKLLKHKDFNCVWALKINREVVSKAIKDAKLKQGESIAEHYAPVA
jgi:hypothetical protein